MILRVTDDLGSRVNAGPNQAGTARPGRRPPTWVGVGQPPVRHSGRPPRLLPDAAIVSEPPARFAPFAAPFQQALANYGRSPLPVGVHGPGHVVPMDEQAREEFWPHWRADEARGADGPMRLMLNVGHNVAMALGGLRWSLKRAHLVSTAVFDNEHSLTFAEGGDRLPDQPGDGRLVCRAVADNQCPTTLGQAFDHPLKR